MRVGYLTSNKQQLESISHLLICTCSPSGSLLANCSSLLFVSFLSNTLITSSSLGILSINKVLPLKPTISKTPKISTRITCKDSTDSSGIPQSSLMVGMLCLPMLPTLSSRCVRAEKCGLKEGVASLRREHLPSLLILLLHLLLQTQASTPSWLGSR